MLLLACWSVILAPSAKASEPVVGALPGDPKTSLTCTVDEDFENGASGWSNDGASTCATGAYVVGNPGEVVTAGVTTQVGGSHSGVSSVFTATNSSAGVDDVDGGNCILTSPSWSVGETSTLSAWYWHGQRDAGDDAAGDFFQLEYSTDGGTSWTSLASSGDVVSNAVWTQATATVPGASSVRLRMQTSDGAGPGDIVEAGLDDVSLCPVPEEPPWPETSPHNWVAPGDPDLALTLTADLLSVAGQTHTWLARAVDTQDGSLVVEISATVDYGPVDTIWTVTSERFPNRWGFEPIPRQTTTTVLATEYDDNGAMVTATTGHLTWFAVYLAANPLQQAAAGWVANGCNWPCSDKWDTCCRAHDACYCAGGDAAARKICDDAFRLCLRGAGMSRFTAFFYYWAVRIFGGSHFNFHE